MFIFQLSIFQEESKNPNLLEKMANIREKRQSVNTFFAKDKRLVEGRRFSEIGSGGHYGGYEYSGGTGYEYSGGTERIRHKQSEMKHSRFPFF